MKKFIIFCFLSFTSVYSQTDFWSHYSLNYPIRQLIEKPEGVLYAVSDSLIFKSSDFGITWTEIYHLQISPDFINGLRLEINTNSFSSYTLIARDNFTTNYDPQISIDGGSNWENLIFPGTFRDVAIASSGDIYLLSDTLYKSSDNGLTWNYITTPNDYRLGSLLSIDENDNLYIYRGRRVEVWEGWILIYTYYEANFYRSSDQGQNWTNLFWDFDEQFFTEMFNVPQGNLFVYYLDKNQTRHYRNGYNKIYSGKINSAIFEGDIIKYASSLNGINFTTNNGQTWAQENSGLPNLNTYSLVRDSLGYIYTGTSNGIYKSNFTSFWLSPDFFYEFPAIKIGDTTYKQITLTNPYPYDLIVDSIKCTSDYFFISSISSYTIATNDSIIIKVGFSPEFIGEFANIINIYADEIIGRIETSGMSPTPTIILIPFNALFGQVIIGDTVTRSIPFSSESINIIRIDSIYTKNSDFFLEPIRYPLYIEPDDTVSFDVGFSPLSHGIKFDTLVVLSNSTNSPFEVRLFGTGKNPTNVEEDEEIIKMYYLSSNYPNPFNPTTTIEYAVPNSSFITIKVYNLLGEEVEILVNEVKNMGKYEVTFDAKNLTSGIYFYSMQSGNFKQIKKFILIK